MSEVKERAKPGPKPRSKSGKAMTFGISMPPHLIWALGKMSSPKNSRSEIISDLVEAEAKKLGLTEQAFLKEFPGSAE